MIAIVDYGMGNLGSILNMCRKVGVRAKITKKIHDIQHADKLILPGVGAFDTGMKNITSLGLLPILQQKALKEKIPVLGICLGMQLYCKTSQEGNRSGLGWIDGEVTRFDFTKDNIQLKIPHMGWNTLRLQKKNTLFNKMGNDSRFYFVHSYHVLCRNSADILTLTEYGYPFVSSLHRDNLYGVQFHPEKSHKFGMDLLYNFSLIS